MRLKTQFGKVVSSHSSACGASSLVAKLRIDSRSCSCSSLKMKCRRFDPKSGLRTVSAVAIGRLAPVRLRGTVAEHRGKVNSGTVYFPLGPAPKKERPPRFQTATAALRGAMELRARVLAPELHRPDRRATPVEVAVRPPGAGPPEPPAEDDRAVRTGVHPLAYRGANGCAIAAVDLEDLAERVVAATRVDARRVAEVVVAHLMPRVAASGALEAAGPVQLRQVVVPPNLVDALEHLERWGSGGCASGDDESGCEHGKQRERHDARHEYPFRNSVLFLEPTG